MSDNTNNLSFSARERILRFLMTQGSMSDENADLTVKKIAQKIDLSTNVVWNYLVVLEKEGFITKKRKKGRTGRPAMVYSISEKGLELFPKTYMEFCITILDEIKEMYGEEELQKMFSNIGKKLAIDMRNQMRPHLQDRTTLNNLKLKLENLMEIFEQHGTYPKLVETDTSFTITNYNCLMHGVAKANPMICTVDETIFHDIIGQQVIKEKCFGDGDKYCLFRIEKEL